MRPVDKWNPGTITMPDGSHITVPATFNDYHDAKPYLSMNFGNVCSYCENSFKEEARDLHVEHIQPKGLTIYAHLKNVWSNFLLSCATCNGADNKGDQNVVYGHCHLPHLNNTFLSLQYDAGGVVTINPGLTGLSQVNAKALLKLVGLDKSPATSSPGDKRFLTRKKNWDLANKYLNKYRNGEIDVDTIIDLINARGGWSIWFTVFKGCDEVRKALIEQFPGTAQCCFDAANHYEPLARNPHNVNDPV